MSTVPAPVATLLDLVRGELGVVESVTLPGPLGDRLRDLGFLAGTPVRLVRRSPLGDPAVYELRGTQLCLRRREAAGVRIRRGAAPPPR